ncbi:putative leucine-rich repeat-containing protein DDB_G0290503 isoform X2 [Clytia hemisphaerica]|uniref:putative leucine-rich repeat-containing protein DDB_G0290503 isoform X2 n=1 Tax=Clytia hemisphaerica TaxID=252671 RepID=UPI0034D4399C
MTKTSVRRKFGMVGTLDSNSGATSGLNGVRIDQYPEQRFHFSKSFDHDDRPVNQNKDSSDFCPQIGNICNVERPRAKTIGFENQDFGHTLGSEKVRMSTDGLFVPDVMNGNLRVESCSKKISNGRPSPCSFEKPGSYQNSKSINSSFDQPIMNTRVNELRTSECTRLRQRPDPRNRLRSESCELVTTSLRRNDSFLRKLRKTFSLDAIDLSSVKDKLIVKCDTWRTRSMRQRKPPADFARRRRSFSTSEIENVGKSRESGLGERVWSLHRLPFSYEAKQENNVMMLKLAKAEQQLHEALEKNKVLQDKLSERGNQLEDVKRQVKMLTAKLEREIQSSGDLYNKVKELEKSIQNHSLNGSLVTDNNDNEVSLDTSFLNESIEQLEDHLRRRSITPIGDLMLSCTLCNARIRIDELESHSVKCSSGNAKKANGSGPKSPTQPGMLVATVTCAQRKGSIVGGGPEECNSFKVICKTTIPEYKQTLLVSERTKEDFLWFRKTLEVLHPERIIPPLKFQDDLAANLREIQRFLSRTCVHKVLKSDSLVRKFFEATNKELDELRRNLEAKLPSPMKHHKPAVEVEDQDGVLYKTQKYVSQLLMNLESLVEHFRSSNNKTGDGLSQCFKMLSEGEPADTYLKSITSSLSSIIRDLENKNSVIYDESVLAEDLESILDMVQSADELLCRVENCVNTFLYWEEEIRVFEEMKTEGLVTSSNGKDITHLWAEASSNCRTAKDELERMCRHLSEELKEFDYRKEQELKQVFIEYAESRFDVFEKMQSKWFGVKLMLDTDIVPSLRAIDFNDPNS